MGRRRPCVAGTFYPAAPGRLVGEIEGYLGGSRDALGPPGPRLSGPVGLILPHAGYPYCGAVAAAGYRALWRAGRPEAVIILGTNHTGLGGPLVVGEPGEWDTPLGPLPVDEGLARGVAEALGAPQADSPFLEEHSVEVQLPFLRYLFGELRFVPVVVQHLAADVAARAGEALAEVVRGRGVGLIASSDFTHYESDGVAREKDREALDRILALDLLGFLEVVASLGITICGVGAIAILLSASLALGLSDAQLLSYHTSGEVVGMREQVVGYAAVLLRRRDDTA